MENAARITGLRSAVVPSLQRCRPPRGACETRTCTPLLSWFWVSRFRWCLRIRISGLRIHTVANAAAQGPTVRHAAVG